MAAARLHRHRTLSRPCVCTVPRMLKRAFRGGCYRSSLTNPRTSLAFRWLTSLGGAIEKTIYGLVLDSHRPVKPWEEQAVFSERRTASCGSGLERLIIYAHLCGVANPLSGAGWCRCRSHPRLRSQPSVLLGRTNTGGRRAVNWRDAWCMGGWRSPTNIGLTSPTRPECSSVGDVEQRYPVY